MDITPSQGFTITGVAEISEAPGGLPRLDLQTDASSAQVYLQGAHVTQFRPRGGAPVLFVSSESHFTPGQPIRGGIPLCFPWFGPHADHPEFPAHGFARISEWEIESLTGSAANGVEVCLRLTSNDATRALWPHDFLARYRLGVGAELALSLEVQNTSADPFTFEEALHTYLTVSDAREISITGLEGADYLDKTDALRRKLQGPQPIRIVAETDRIYFNTATTCVLDDPGTGGKTVIEKSGSNTTVVWNPWTEKAAALADFGDDEWSQMVCIETGNAAENAVRLAPGETHRISAVIRTKPPA